MCHLKNAVMPAINLERENQTTTVCISWKRPRLLLKFQLIKINPWPSWFRESSLMSLRQGAEFSNNSKLRFVFPRAVPLILIQRKQILYLDGLLGYRLNKKSISLKTITALFWAKLELAWRNWKRQQPLKLPFLVRMRILMWSPSLVPKKALIRLFMRSASSLMNMWVLDNICAFFL